MKSDDRLNKMRDEWSALDQAMIDAGYIFDPMNHWPWQSSNPQVMAAWEDLTKPEHLADLEFRLAYFDDGAAMNDWAANVTRKAIEVIRSKQSDQPSHSK